MYFTPNNIRNQILLYIILLSYKINKNNRYFLKIKYLEYILITAFYYLYYFSFTSFIINNFQNNIILFPIIKNIK